MPRGMPRGPSRASSSGAVAGLEGWMQRASRGALAGARGPRPWGPRGCFFVPRGCYFVRSLQGNFVGSIRLPAMREPLRVT